MSYDVGSVEQVMKIQRFKSRAELIPIATPVSSFNYPDHIKTKQGHIRIFRFCNESRMIMDGFGVFYNFSTLFQERHIRENS